MKTSFAKRSYEPEILDDFDLQGNDLSRNLAELQKVNSFLGGYAAVKSGIRKILRTRKFIPPVSIADAGCGSGDSLRMLSGWSEKKGIALRLQGLDANERALSIARELSGDIPGLSFAKVDVLSGDFRSYAPDIFMFNLFLHHFSDEQIIRVREISLQNGSSVLINDLQRSRLAYTLFSIVSFISGFSYISRHDGKLSIRKSFTRKEWKALLVKADIHHYEIRWKWAFRYQVIIF